MPKKRKFLTKFQWQPQLQRQHSFHIGPDEKEIGKHWQTNIGEQTIKLEKVTTIVSMKDSVFKTPYNYEE